MSTNFLNINTLSSLNNENNNKTTIFKFKSLFLDNDNNNHDNEDISNSSQFLIKKKEINNHSFINPFADILNNTSIIKNDNPFKVVIEKNVKPFENKNMSKNIENSLIIEKEEKCKCNHKKYFASFCIDDPIEEGGLMCYECLYKYHKNHISKCIPIKTDYFPIYKNHYKNCIKKYKEKLTNKFEKIISLLDNYENEEMEDISYLLEKKLDISFELPIEIPFIERLEIGVNKKISSIVEREIINIQNDNHYNYSVIYLNLFQNELKKLKLIENNSKDTETIKFRSSVNLNLLGLGIPKIKEGKEEDIEVNLFKDNSLLEDKLKFENNDNLSVGIFESGKIEVIKDNEYSIMFKYIKDFTCISREEKHNDNSKITAKSNNPESILACLIIELN